MDSLDRLVFSCSDQLPGIHHKFCLHALFLQIRHQNADLPQSPNLLFLRLVTESVFFIALRAEGGRVNTAIISPTTANRIPRSPGADNLVAELLGHGINAAAFVMDEDLLEAAESKGFKNDLDRALLDLIRQLPPAVCDAIFPPSPTEEVTTATSDVLGGNAANADGKREVSMAPPRRRRSIEPRMRF